VSGTCIVDRRLAYSFMTRKARTPKTSVRPKLETGVSRQEDAVVDPVWRVYFDGRPNEISRAACGYTLDEWLAGGKDFFRQVATPQSLANIRAAAHAVRTRGVTLHNVECEIRGKETGRHYHFLINYQPVFNGANEIVGVRGDARDVTELMQFERALGRGAGLLVSLIESTSDLFWAFYLKYLPADYLKIDGAFVQGLADDPVDQAIEQSMNQVAHASGKETIAEFVENARSLELLRRDGVDFTQGYHVGDSRKVWCASGESALRVA
jgi:hypothetical protein